MLMAFDREWMKERVAELAGKGVFLEPPPGNIPAGWASFTPRSVTRTRGKVAKTRFERDCLSEYAGVFNTVCVDAAYYDFPRPEYLRKLADAMPDGFRFGFKVTDAVTIKQFANLPRFGAKAGKTNPDFLNADLFATAFLKPCEAVREKAGVFIFEFSRFWPSDYQHGADFVRDLDGFLAKLPKGWPYAVEMRNSLWLRDGYFDCLARHGVTHVFNSWHAMPPVNEQMALPRSRTNPELVAARFLLKPGRKYEEAVKAFQPYDMLHETNEEARAAAASLIAESLRAAPRRKTYIYVNNRLEGNALMTLQAIVGLLGGNP